MNLAAIKVIVFDFDNTLKLHEANKVYRDFYESQVRESVKILSTKYKLAIASNSIFSFVKDELIKMDILKYFTKIIVNPEISKTKMLKELLQLFQVEPNEILFYDDDVDNIDEAKNLKINTICVSKRQGINFSAICKNLESSADSERVLDLFYEYLKEYGCDRTRNQESYLIDVFKGHRELKEDTIQLFRSFQSWIEEEKEVIKESVSYLMLCAVIDSV